MAKTSWWSKVGDEVGGVVEAVAHPAATALSAVGNAAYKVVDEGTFGGLHQDVAVLKGASRLALAGAQAGIEGLAAAVRSGGAVDQFGVMHPDKAKEISDQTTAGQIINKATRGEKVDLGKGWFPAGEAHKAQAQAARDAMSIDGHAATIGRLAADVFTEPGTKPYNVLSGLLDAGVSWYGDPGAIALKGAGEARAAESTFRAVTGAEDVARAAEQATPEWRQAVEAAAGMVSEGHRPTVVPQIVDKWLYSTEAQAVTDKLATTSSPTEIWRAFDKKIDPSLAVDLAHASDRESVLGVLRPALGVQDGLVDVPKVGRFTGDLGPLARRVVSTAQQQIRSLNTMPETWLPFDDPATFVRNLDDGLANAKVNGAERNAILDRAMGAITSGSEGDRVRLLNTASDAVEASLKSYGVDEKLARDLTSWAGDQDKVRRFLTDDAGNNVNFDFLKDADGNPIQGAKPAALVELLNSGSFLYDPSAVRTIRRLTSKLSLITDTEAAKTAQSAVDFLQQELWKPAQTIRGAFFARVNSEEVARSLAGGRFNDALDWLNFAAHGRGETDALGGGFDLENEAHQLVESLATGTADDAAAAKARLNQINDEILQGKSAYDDAKAARAWKGVEFGQTEKNLIRSGSYNLASKDAQPFLWAHGLADEAIATAQDPIIRRVANGGLFEGDIAQDARPGIDGIKDWLTSGSGQAFRAKFEGAYPGIDFTNEAVLDDVLSKAQMRLNKLPENVRQAVADGGMLDGERMWTETRDGRVPTKALLDHLDQWAADPASPRLQKFEQTFFTTGQRPAILQQRDKLVDWFFGSLYGKTSDYLARSPVFKSSYWDEIDRLVPWLDEPSRTSLLVNAEKADLGSSRVKSLRDRIASTAPGQVDLVTADGLAKGRALDATKKLLYDASERSQFFDISRAVFPFGEAWKEVLGRWATITAENPQVPRRAQQIIEGARGAKTSENGRGFFYRDPATGQEMFGYPLPGPLADFLGVQMKGSVAQLSLATSVIPGIGPVASVALDRLAPHTPATDQILSILEPYGKPSSITGQLAPPWAKKLVAAWQGNPDNDRVYANQYVEAVRQLAASGKYGTTPDEMQRLEGDARTRARLATGLRALAQFVVPAAPQFDYEVAAKGGDAVAAVLVKDYADLREQEHRGDIPDATQAFFDKYGEQAYAYLVGKTQSTVGGQQATTAYGKWEQQNGDLIAKYPDIAGWLGPQGGQFNSTVFSRQEAEGKRTRRSADAVLKDAQSTVASWMWNQAKDAAGPNPNDAQAEVLRQIKAKVQGEYPAWNPDAVPYKLPGRIRQLQQAVEDPKVKGTALGGALADYFEVRDAAFAAAKNMGLGTPMKAKSAKNLRDVLRVAGSMLADKTPEFKAVWTDLLSHEMTDDLGGSGG